MLRYRTGESQEGCTRDAQFSFDRNAGLLLASKPLMSARKISVYAAVLLLGFGAVSLHADARAKQRKETRKEIERLEAACRQAALQGDAAAFDRLTADDYIGISPNGTFETKQQLLAALSSGKMHFRKIDYSDTKIRIYGDTAVVTTTADVEGSNDSVRDFTGKYRYTRVYTRHNPTGTWRIVSFESSRVKPEH